MVSFIYSFFFLQKASYNFNPWKPFSFCGCSQFMHTPVLLRVPEYSFVYRSVASPASQGTGCFDGTKSIEGLKGFYSLAVLRQSTVNCTASLWIDPTVHFWQWIERLSPASHSLWFYHQPQDCSMALSTIGFCPPRVSSQKIKQNVYLWIVPMSGKEFL